MIYSASRNLVHGDPTYFVKRQVLALVLGVVLGIVHLAHRLPEVARLLAHRLHRRGRPAVLRDLAVRLERRRATRPGSSSRSASSSSRPSSPSSGSSSRSPATSTSTATTSTRGGSWSSSASRSCRSPRPAAGRPGDEHRADLRRHRAARRRRRAGALPRDPDRARPHARSSPSSASGSCSKYQVDRLTTVFSTGGKSQPRRAYNQNQSKATIVDGGSGEGLFNGPPDQPRVRARAADRLHLHRRRRGARLRRRRDPARPVRPRRVAHLADRPARRRTSSGRWSAPGCSRIFAFQIFENIGMTMGIMPITGHPAAVHDLRRLGAHRHLRRASARRQRHTPAGSAERPGRPARSAAVTSLRYAHEMTTCGRGSSRSWPGWRSPLATSAWSRAASGRDHRARPGCLAPRSIPTPTRSASPTRGSRSSTRS